MIEQQSFEEKFNEWYKKFLVEEGEMNNLIRNAKLEREDKLKKAREEADETIKQYDKEQKEKLEAEKEKLNVEKNNFDQMDADFQKEVENMKQLYKQNKSNVVKFILEKALKVELNLPESYKANKTEEIRKKEKQGN